MGARQRNEQSAMTKPQPLSLDELAPALMEAGELVYDWDIVSDRLRWSPGAERLLGADAETLATGQGFAGLVDDDSPGTRQDAIFACPLKDNGKGISYTAEYRLNTGAGERVWVHDTGIWHSNEKGEPVRARGIVRVFPGDGRSFHSGQLSPFDPTSGQLNAIRLFDRLENTIRISEHKGTSAGFLLVAVKNLSVINRAYGFEVADTVIAATGRRLAENLRGRDTVGRYSGNKFGIVLPGCDDASMRTAAQRLIGALQEAPVQLAQGQINIDIAVGGVVVPRHARSARQAALHAHEALDAARKQRGAAFASYVQSRARERRREENLRMADEIIRALNEQRVGLHFQPVVSAASSATAFHECLLKLTGSDNLAYPAQNVIEAAERLEMVQLLDCRVLELACEALFADPARRLSINISAKTANDPEWISLLASLRRCHGSFERRLIIEITETAAMHDIDDVEHFVSLLQEMDCQVAIDDFGAGFTCFRHLRQLHPDMVKIDGAFVQKLHASRENQVFCKALIDIARAFDIAIVAEFVEDEKDAALLRQWGVDYLQGFLFGQPAARPDAPGSRQERRSA